MKVAYSKKLIFRFALIALLIAILSRGCHDENFTEEEQELMIQNAVTYFVNERQPGGASSYSEEEGRWISKSYIPYPSAEEFLLENPNCCVVAYRGEDGFLPPVLRRIRYGYRGHVSINNYKLRPLDQGALIDEGPVIAIPMNARAVPIPEMGFYGD